MSYLSIAFNLIHKIYYFFAGMFFCSIFSQTAVFILSIGQLGFSTILCRGRDSNPHQWSCTIPVGPFEGRSTQLSYLAAAWSWVCVRTCQSWNAALSNKRSKEQMTVSKTTSCFFSLMSTFKSNSSRATSLTWQESCRAELLAFHLYLKFNEAPSALSSATGPGW